MKDIPRNELLDKLSAGWKVRRKGWDDASMLISKDYGSNSRQVGWWELLKDDWEGEPPEPVLRFKNCDIVFAFNELQNHGAKFICRPSWREEYDDWTPIESAGGETLLETRDILANDWEVWG